MKDGPKVAVLGAGAWGMNLIRNLHALEALEVVCDINHERLDEVRRKYPQVKVTPSPDEVFKNDCIQGVVIATPAATHTELALRALEVGKDVLVEKPMALSVKDGEKIVEEAERRGCVLMVGHVLEYHPAILRLRELLSEGVLGRLEYIYSNRLNFGKFRREENALWSFAPHDVALLLRLVGEMPQEVSAHGGAYLSGEVADVTVSNFLFPGGVRAHIFVSWLHPYKEQRLVVIGDRAMAVFEDTLPWPEKLRIYRHKIEWREGRIPVAARAEAEPVPVEEVEPLRAECEHFLECVAGRKRPLTDGESGLKVLKVLEACQKSLARGGERVGL